MTSRILVLEPFGGGSHASLYRGWSKFSQHEFTILDLPAVHWKWRSRHSSLTLALRANELVDQGARFDVVFASDMLNLPEWQGLVRPSLQCLPTVVYFHENQLTYPLSEGQQRDYHYGYTNVLSAIAANQVWFNSQFHCNEFTNAASELLKRMPDFAHNDLFQAAMRASLVMPPGIEPPESLTNLRERHRLPPRASCTSPITIGWVARWEHDKRPDRFVHAVKRLVETGEDFRLVLLGQQFKNQPASLDQLLEVAGDRVLHCGYVESVEEYWTWLSKIDVVVSTADHEFFGLGIVEAVHAGATPLVPNRLAYPEVLSSRQKPNSSFGLYDGEDQLVELLKKFARSKNVPPCEFNMQKFTWSRLSKEYDAAINRLRRPHDS